MTNKKESHSDTACRRFLAFVLMLVLIYTTTQSPALALDKDDPIAAQLAFKSGKALYDQRKFPEAQKFFTKAATAGSKNAVNQYYLGLAAAQNGDVRTVKRAMARILVRNSPASGNAKQATAMLQRYAKDCQPYNCTTAANQTVRFLKSDMPIKIFMTNGVMLPASYRGKAGFTVGEMQNLVSLLRHGDAYVGRLEHDPNYTYTHRTDVIRGLQNWRWASAEGLFTYQLVNSANDCDIIVFWCPEITNQMGGYTSSGNWGASGKKVVIQIATGNPSRSKDPKQVSDYTTWVGMHEFGHAWGFMTHSPNPQDIMYSTANFDAVPGVISENDKTSLRAVYDIAPDIGM